MLLEFGEQQIPDVVANVVAVGRSDTEGTPDLLKAVGFEHENATGKQVAEVGTQLMADVGEGLVDEVDQVCCQDAWSRRATSARSRRSSSAPGSSVPAACSWAK